MQGGGVQGAGGAVVSTCMQGGGVQAACGAVVSARAAPHLVALLRGREGRRVGQPCHRLGLDGTQSSPERWNDSPQGLDRRKASRERRRALGDAAQLGGVGDQGVGGRMGCVELRGE